jgi:hypothetical protein
MVDMITFKWECFGRNHHIFGCIMHVAYLVIFVLYVDRVYVHHDGNEDEHMLYNLLLAAGILYPWIYDLI